MYACSASSLFKQHLGVKLLMEGPVVAAASLITNLFGSEIYNFQLFCNELIDVQFNRFSAEEISIFNWK